MITVIFEFDLDFHLHRKINLDQYSSQAILFAEAEDSAIFSTELLGDCDALRLCILLRIEFNVSWSGSSGSSASLNDQFRTNLPGLNGVRAIKCTHVSQRCKIIAITCARRTYKNK